MAVLRSRHSWTRWRRSLRERRLAREVRRLTLLQALLVEQETRVLAAEQLLHPPMLAAPALVPEASPPVPPPSPSPETARPAERPALPWEAEPLTPEERAELEAQSTPGPLLLAQELGLSLPQMSSPSSAS